MDVEPVLNLHVGIVTHPTQPPHPQLEWDTSRGDLTACGDVSSFVDTSGFPVVSGSDVTAIYNVGLGVAVKSGFLH